MASTTERGGRTDLSWEKSEGRLTAPRSARISPIWRCRGFDQIVDLVEVANPSFDQANASAQNDGYCSRPSVMATESMRFTVKVVTPEVAPEAAHAFATERGERDKDEVVTRGAEPDLTRCVLTCANPLNCVPIRRQLHPPRWNAACRTAPKSRSRVPTASRNSYGCTTRRAILRLLSHTAKLRRPPSLGAAFSTPASQDQASLRNCPGRSDGFRARLRWRSDRRQVAQRRRRYVRRAVAGNGRDRPLDQQVRRPRRRRRGAGGALGPDAVGGPVDDRAGRDPAPDGPAGPCAWRGDRPHGHHRDRQDHPRDARGALRVHRSCLQPRRGADLALHRQDVPVDPGAVEQQATRTDAPPDRRRCRHCAVQLPDRHLVHRDRPRARSWQHRRVEAVRVRAACLRDGCRARRGGRHSGRALSTSSRVSGTSARHWSSTTASTASSSPAPPPPARRSPRRRA